MKKLLFLLMAIWSFSAIAQVDNYAFKFNGSGTIDSGPVNSINGLDTYTLQFWISPDQWINGATILQRDANNDNILSITLGTPGNLIYKAGSKQLTINSDKLKEAEWAQVTIRQEDSGITAWINNTKVVTNAPVMNIPSSSANLYWGDNFKGRMDEIRLWKEAINLDYLLWQNTLNKFHPNYESLLLYYKGDQKKCITRVVDYVNQHHATMSIGVTREKVTDNSLMVYKLLTAYTSIARIFDRKIPIENYQLANDIIILNVGFDRMGKASISTPNCHAKFTNATHLTSYKGRNGVVSLNGDGAKMEPGLEALCPIDGWYQRKNTFSLNTWIYIEKWTEGAFIYRKERSDTEGFSVRLGNQATKELIVRMNGLEYKWNNLKNKPVLKVGEWMHLGVSSVGQNETNRPAKLFNVGFNGVARYGDEAPTEKNKCDLTPYADIALVIGENLNAKLDQTSIWHGESSQNYMTKEMNGGLQIFQFGVELGEDYSDLVRAYYQYDDSAKPGYSSFSADEIIKTVRSAFEGREGYVLRLGLAGDHAGMWMSDITKPEVVKRLVASLKELVESTGADGLETDLEGWWGGVNYSYSDLIIALKKAMPDKIISATPHAIWYKFTKDVIKVADRFTFQIYTNPEWYTMAGYKKAYNRFVDYGYPKDKIVLSYGATTGFGSLNHTENGYKSVIGYDPRPDVEWIKTPDGNVYDVVSVNQARERAQFLLDNNVLGLMYWDMGNDLPATDELCLCRSVNFATSSNVDLLYTDETIPPTGIESKPLGNPNLMVFPNPAKEYVTVKIPDGQTISKISIYNLNGSLIHKYTFANNSAIETLNNLNLSTGIYQINVQNANNKHYTQSLIIH